MAEKKVKGRKRHVITDTMGNLLIVKVHAANTHDTVAGCDVFKAAIAKYPSILGCHADAGYRGTFVDFVIALGKTVKISEKIKPKEWVIFAQRWVVERTLSWFNNSRRLSKDYEISVASSENMVVISNLATLLKRF
jgi:transposase